MKLAAPPPHLNDSRGRRSRILEDSGELSLCQIAHLYRRAGFGATSEDLAAATKVGYEATVQNWIAGLGVPDPGASKIQAPPTISMGEYFAARGAAHQRALVEAINQWPIIIPWWIARMVAAQNPLTEKLTLVLHNLFPTAIAKVGFPKDMVTQNELFCTKGPGRFDDLVTLVAHDTAMLMWLDAFQMGGKNPNENFPRELMERFTMGIGNYTQADVHAAAVCFSGIVYDYATEKCFYEPVHHAPLTFLGHRGILQPTQVLKLVTHSAASHAYVPSRFWSWLAWPVQPGDRVLVPLVDSYAADLSVSSLLKNIFLHPEFRSPKAVRGLVKQPIEYVAGALRALDFSPQEIARGHPPLYPALSGMGQIPFDPPSVGGWGQNRTWLSSASVLARWRFASEIVKSKSANLSTVVDAPPRARPAAAAELLSIASWSPTTERALAQVAKDPEAVTTVALISPEYVTN